MLLASILQSWKGDLPAMRERRILRVLVSYSPTRFQIVDGEKRGFEAEMMQRLEQFLNEGVAPDQRLEVVFLPSPFEELVPNLLAGRGDLVAAGMTITPALSRKVAFSDPYRKDVSEVVVTNRGISSPSTLEELSGRTVSVVRGSSWAESMRRVAKERKIAVEVDEVDPYLEVHDVLELVNAGVYEMTVADHHEAELWAQVLPDLVVRPDLEVAGGRSLGWAMRPGSPKLLAEVNRFVREHRQGTLMGNMLFGRYFEKTEWVRNPLSAADRARLDRLRPLFQDYAQEYGLDWVMLAAQGFQESGLDQSKKSRAGAVGVMQLKPSTAADPAIGIADISTEDSNIHAAAKYLAYLRDTYFADPEIEPLPRLHLTLAGYNAGPGRIRELRKIAAERGLDPNRWFGNVELIAMEKVGPEPVRYIANIHKYYVAYRLALEVGARREEALSAL